MNLDGLTRMIGSIIISAFIMSVPILCVLSFVYGWELLLQILLIWGTLFEVAVLALIIYRGE